jgi:hypothetical protein
MYVDYGISFSEDKDEVSYPDGSLINGVNEFTYNWYHIPTNTREARTIYVLGGLEEVGHLLNEWNKAMPDVWQYSMDN